MNPPAETKAGEPPFYSSACPVGGWVGNAPGEGVMRRFSKPSHPIRTRAPYGSRWSAVEVQDGGIWPYQTRHRWSPPRLVTATAAAQGTTPGQSASRPPRPPPGPRPASRGPRHRCRRPGRVGAVPDRGATGVRRGHRDDEALAGLPWWWPARATWPPELMAHAQGHGVESASGAIAAQASRPADLPPWPLPAGACHMSRTRSARSGNAGPCRGGSHPGWGLSQAWLSGPGSG